MVKAKNPQHRRWKKWGWNEYRKEEKEEKKRTKENEERRRRRRKSLMVRLQSCETGFPVISVDERSSPRRYPLFFSPISHSSSMYIYIYIWIYICIFFFFVLSLYFPAFYLLSFLTLIHQTFSYSTPLGSFCRCERKKINTTVNNNSRPNNQT